MDLMGTLLDLAGRQYRAVTRQQALAAGWSSATFARTMNRQAWQQLYEGVWCTPGEPPDDLTWAFAAALAGGDRALITGRFGLALHGAVEARGWKPRLVVPMSRHVVRHLDRPRVQVIASRTLQDRDRGSARNFPVATVERCFLDLVIPPTPPIPVVRDLLITATQRRATTAGAVEARAASARGLPGRGVLLRALDDVATIGADSPFTDRVHRRLLDEGLTPDPHPVPVRCPRRTLHPDITFASHRVCLECDSMLAHSGQKDLAIDHRKDREYRAAQWDCYRIGWYEFEHNWRGFVADLRRALTSTR